MAKLRFLQRADAEQSWAITALRGSRASNFERMQPLASAQSRASTGRDASTWPGMLLGLKGDRVAMNSSVETRYPFLDEEVFDFLARIHPRWKMRGLQRQVILRLLAERYLPHRGRLAQEGDVPGPARQLLPAPGPPYVDQLLSEESLKKTGYFNVEAVRHWLRIMQEGRLRFTAALLGRAGPGRRGHDAALASHVRRQLAGGDSRRLAAAGGCRVDQRDGSKNIALAKKLKNWFSLDGFGWSVRSLQRRESSAHPA